MPPSSNSSSDFAPVLQRKRDFLFSSSTSAVVNSLSSMPLSLSSFCAAMMKVAAVSFEPPKSVASSSGIAVASSITELIPASFILRAVVGPIPSISPISNSATFLDVFAIV
jgi:hypothetical protein